MEKVMKKYEFAVIATDSVVFALDEGALKVLLIRMNKEPFRGMWAVPGGLVRGDESIDNSAKRLLQEKTGVKNVFIEQLYSFGDVDRDPFGRVVSIAYLALTPNANINIKTTKEYGEISWFAANELPELAYDHEAVVAAAVKRLQSKLEYTNIIFQLLPREFTMKELQNAYEEIRGEKLDKRNFQKKILALDMVKRLDKKTAGLAHRPATMYAAKDKELKEAKIL